MLLLEWRSVCITESGPVGGKCGWQRIYCSLFYLHIINPLWWLDTTVSSCYYNIFYKSTSISLTIYIISFSYCMPESSQVESRLDHSTSYHISHHTAPFSLFVIDLHCIALRRLIRISFSVLTFFILLCYIPSTIHFTLNFKFFYDFFILLN